MSYKYQEIYVSKIDIAKVQLDAAINAYFDGRYIEAITLAGATEEIFGAMLRRSGKQNALEKIAQLPAIRSTYNTATDRFKFLNGVRNNLKHADDKRDDYFIISEIDPFLMIVRALGNSSLLGIEDTRLMKQFRAHHSARD